MLMSIHNKFMYYYEHDEYVFDSANQTKGTFDYAALELHTVKAKLFT